MIYIMILHNNTPIHIVTSSTCNARRVECIVLFESKFVIGYLYKLNFEYKTSTYLILTNIIKEHADHR